MSSQHAFISRRSQRRARLTSTVCSVIESLEGRTLFNATMTSPVSTVQLAPSTTAPSIDLSQHFTDPLLTGTPAIIDTSLGLIPLQLSDTTTPQTVHNFLTYIASNLYNGTVIQRAVPGFILQGGGFLPDQSHIQTTSPVPNEFSTSNTAGTIAMALSTDPNTHIADPASATSDWFINDADNSAVLDPQKFTVFGKVIYDGMTVVNQIEALPKGAVSPTFEPSSGDPTDGVLPLTGGYNTGSPIRTSNYVITNTIAQVQPVVFRVTSDNTDLVTAGINGTKLSITSGTATGVAHLTITAIDLGGNQVQQVLTVQVGSTQVSLGDGAARSVTFTDPDGTRSTISYSGSGLATISFAGLGLTLSGSSSKKVLTGTPIGVSISATGTSATNSNMTITGTGGTNKLVDIAGIQLTSPLHSLVGKNTNLTAALTDSASIGTLTLGTVTTSSITLGAGAPVRFTVGTMNASSLFATGVVTAVTANTWTGGGSITATGIGQVKVKGAFAGTVSGKTLSSFAAGTIGAGTWTVSGAVGKITAKGISDWQASLGTLGSLQNLGAMTSSRLNTTGSIKTISVASLTSSNILAAVLNATLPSSNSDFTSKATIGTLTVKGAYVGSNIAAANFTNLSVGPITTNNSGAIFGIGALAIKSFKFALAGKKVTLRNVSAEEQVTNVFAALGVAPQDLAVRIL